VDITQYRAAQMRPQCSPQGHGPYVSQGRGQSRHSQDRGSRAQIRCQICLDRFQLHSHDAY
jgi:hypothetical protein